MRKTPAPTVIDLQIPRYFRPRSYQKEFVRAMRAGCRRAIMLWHRRAGKDDTALNWNIEAMVQRPGGYYYFFPTLKQGRRILWKGIQSDGRPFLEHFPKELIIGEPNETEMSIKLAVPGGGYSLFQILGANEVDNSSIGTNPVGCVFSEYSLQNPGAWDLMRPILAENEGWAVFAYTPRGKNWGYKLWQAALDDRGTWFTSLKTVDHTVRDGENEGHRFGHPVVSGAAIEAERRSGMAEELIQQEFYCSFEGAVMGSYYGDAIDRMIREGRVRDLPWKREIEVDTAWDLGIGDDETVIGFFQTIPDIRTGRDELHLIDVHAGRNQGFSDYWRFMRNEKPYTYNLHYGPHDLKVHEWHGSTRLATAASLGLHFQVVAKLGIADGINAVRRMLPYLWVDEKRCAKWIDMMRAYHREFDEERMTFLDKPVHDESSHWADMTRYRAVAYDVPPPSARSPRLPDRAEIDYSVFDSTEDRERRGPFDSYKRNAPNWSVFDR